MVCHSELYMIYKGNNKITMPNAGIKLTTFRLGHFPSTFVPHATEAIQKDSSNGGVKAALENYQHAGDEQVLNFNTCVDFELCPGFDDIHVL